MKRYILILANMGYKSVSDAVTIQTDDLRASLMSLFEAGYDIITDFEEDEEFETTGAPMPTKAGLDEIIAKLTAGETWEGEDGAGTLILVDTQNVANDTTLEGYPGVA